MGVGSWLLGIWAHILAMCLILVVNMIMWCLELVLVCQRHMVLTLASRKRIAASKRALLHTVVESATAQH